MKFCSCLAIVTLLSLNILETYGVTNCEPKQDLTFIVDGSGSICPTEPCANWNFTRQFIHRLVDSMTIGPKDIQVALIIFSDNSHIQWNLATYADKTSLLNAIENLPYPGGSTSIVTALDFLTSTVYTPAQGDRPDASDTAIIITDGQLDEPTFNLTAAINNVHDKGIRTLVVGVTTNVNYETLELLSSYPHEENVTVFLARDHSSVDSILDQLRNSTCNPAPIADCPVKQDVTFVVDGSGSICPTQPCSIWNLTIQMIHDLVDSMPIGPDDTRVALILFSDNSRVEWNLSAHTSKRSLLNAIENLSYPGGSTSIVTALDLLTSTIYTAAQGDRPDASDIAIIITDGQLDEPTVNVKAAINNVHDKGIRTQVIGVTRNVNYDTLWLLAISRHERSATIFMARDSSSVDSIRDHLRRLKCQQPPVNIIAVCLAKQDLTFIVDGSGSICPTQPCANWNFTRQFIHRLVDSMAIGPDDTRVALIIFSDNPLIHWNLAGYSDKTSLLTAIDNLPYPSGGTFIVPALDRMTSAVYNPAQGDRPDVPNTAIIITDGQPSESITDVTNAVDRVHMAGIRTLVVGVTSSINYGTLRLLSSPPQKENLTFFLANDYSSVDSIRGQLRDITCKPECTAKLDLTFIVDGSGSICPTQPCANWNFTRQFIHRLVDLLTIGPIDTKVAVIIFSYGSSFQWNLANNLTKASLLTAIDDLPYPGGLTDFVPTLDLLTSAFYTTGQGDRLEFQDTVIIITDGQADESQSDLIEAIDRVHSKGIRTLAVGVSTNINVETLKLLSSQPQEFGKTYFVASNLGTIEEISQQLKDQTCGLPQVFSSTPSVTSATSVTMMIP